MTQLDYFKSGNFYQNASRFYTDLNIPVNSIEDQAYKTKDFLSKNYNPESVAQSLIEHIYLIGMVDNDAFSGDAKYNSLAKITAVNADYPGLVIVGVELKSRENNLLPTRTQLAEITRIINREFEYTPVTVLFKYEHFLALANAERTAYVAKHKEGEKVGKVSLLRDINFENVHTGHWQIIKELKISNKIDTFKALDIQWNSVFSVSILNKRFYKELSNWYFWAIQKVTFPGEPSLDDALMQKKELKDLQQEHRATNVIRMLTRLLFVWFLKEKNLIPDELFDLESLQKDTLNKIDPLHDEGSLFSEGNKESIYYKAILQNLFFATLNCPINSDSQDTRKRAFRSLKSYGTNRGTDFLMRYEKYFKDPESFLNTVNEIVPFLNGGLFECLDDKLSNIYIDGFSDQMTKGEQLIVPDYLFFGADEEADLSDVMGIATKDTRNAAVKGLINILKSYKFTIAENTPIEEEVALDPELLGKVFENLLASYNPETKTTARKQTGSFYTPREIVNYMVDESLIAYLKTKILEEETVQTELGTGQTNLFGNDATKGQAKLIQQYEGSELKDNESELDKKLHDLVSYSSGNPFATQANTSKIILKYLDQCTILDPACGSGAFPMGILQKMVHILEKLDPENKVWREVQIEKAKKLVDDALEIESKADRGDKLQEINEAFDETINNPDYARKLFLVENCIYGVDIQPIATQISKLRFFISLVVEQKVDRAKENFGIRPLPNLETKFVAANTLIGIEKEDNLFSNDGEIKRLEKNLKKINSKIFSARNPKSKRTYKEKFTEIQYAIKDRLIELNFDKLTAETLTSWKPFDQNASCSFFDSEWMFDKTGFDIVIGNPPYGVSIKGLQRKLVLKFLDKVPDFEIYYFFIEVSKNILNNGGILSYIIPNTYLFNVFAKKFREKLISDWDLKFIIDFTNYSLFDSATVRNSVLFMSNAKPSTNVKYLSTSNPNLNLNEFIAQNKSELNISLLKQFSQNWALAFKLSPNRIMAVEEINKNAIALSDIFSEISQGLIAYDKYQGQSEDIIKSRAYHYNVYHHGLKKFLWGEDVRKYQLNWNKKEYIDYCSGIANPRNPKYFVGKRLLIREITNPSIYATITKDEFYNDPSILIVKDSNESLEIVALILNSCIGTFYHFNSAPKATKGDFPKILVKDIKEFPISRKISSIDEIFYNLYDIESYALSNNLFSFTEIIDGFCLELYFAKYMSENSLNILDLLEFKLKEILKKKKFVEYSDKEKRQFIINFEDVLNNKDNEIMKRVSQFKEKSPDLLKVILES